MLKLCSSGLKELLHIVGGDDWQTVSRLMWSMFEVIFYFAQKTLYNVNPFIFMSQDLLCRRLYQVGGMESFMLLVTPFTTLPPTGPFMMSLASAAGVVGMD